MDIGAAEARSTGSEVGRLQRQQQFFDLRQSGRGRFFSQPRELAANHHVIVVAGEHEAIFLYLDRGDVLVSGEDSDFRELLKQLKRRWQRAESIAQFLFQRMHRRFVGGLSELAVNLDALPGVGNVAEGNEGAIGGGWRELGSASCVRRIGLVTRCFELWSFDFGRWTSSLGGANTQEIKPDLDFDARLDLFALL